MSNKKLKNRSKTDNTMAKRNEKGQSMIQNKHCTEN